jgi:hypothetical protein
MAHARRERWGRLRSSVHDNRRSGTRRVTRRFRPAAAAGAARLLCRWLCDLRARRLLRGRAALGGRSRRDPRAAPASGPRRAPSSCLLACWARQRRRPRAAGRSRGPARRARRGAPWTRTPSPHPVAGVRISGAGTRRRRPPDPAIPRRRAHSTVASATSQRGAVDQLTLRVLHITAVSAANNASAPSRNARSSACSTT